MACEKENLFSRGEREALAAHAPLAVRMRPCTLDGFVGQEHFAGTGKLLRRMIEAGNITSLIFYGPPGTGKTTLARIVAGSIKAKFHYLSAPAASVKDVREIIAGAKDRLLTGGAKTLLFIDEIHRFNRAQQDVLLDDVENGIIQLIGATTENPFFSINSPLISRSTVFSFEALSKDDILVVLNRALTDSEKGFGQMKIDADPQALDFLAEICDGDARKALTALEVAVLSQAKGKSAGAQAPQLRNPVCTDLHTAPPTAKQSLTVPPDKSTATSTGKMPVPLIKLTLDIAKESVQRKAVQYDGTGDTHYDLASALQKSMRGSDPDATVYWLARMIVGGEDLRFIARRIAICAAEDVGNADPMATILAASAVQIAEFVGFPEAQLPLAQAAIYIACAPKSNACANAVWDACASVQSGRTIPVPAHLRDSHYAGAKKLGHGLNYEYPHKSPIGYIEQDYLGVQLEKPYYKPKDIGREKLIGEYLQKLKNYVQQYQRQTESDS
ncbi:MAG: replication-associated recombination protein A [Planctomycetota bacterium]|nr:MAG: replication-associated recombination protein A [Planctomycetota bacterium]